MTDNETLRKLEQPFDLILQWGRSRGLITKQPEPKPERSKEAEMNNGDNGHERIRE